MIETNQTTDQPRGFSEEEEGAVTVDWVVLAAAVCLLSVPVLLAVGTSVNSSSSNIASKITDGVGN